MNKENADYLKERMFFLGFGDKLNKQLEEAIKSGKDQFQIPTQGEFSKGDKKQVVDYNLDFSKSKQNDMYFLNKYTATLKHETPEQDRSQTFYLNKGNGVTAKEAYNLLDGRAVFKKLTNRDNEPYEAWMQLNGKKEDNGQHKVQLYHTAYGFDVEKNLAKIPMKETENSEQKEKLLRSLEKGNITPVTLKLAGAEEKAFLEANPKDRNLIIYDAQMVRQGQGIKQPEQNKEQKESASQKQAAGKEAKEEAEGDTKKSKGRKMSV